MFPFDKENAERCINILIGALSMKASALTSRGLTPCFLLVEGRTDYDFFSGSLNDNMVIETAANALSSRDFNLSSKSSPFKSKQAICDVVLGLSKYPILLNCPTTAKEWDVRGIIDADFDDLASLQNATKLYITDKHDLETTLLWSDDKLFFNLDGCQLTQQEVEDALFLAYQSAFVRRYIWDISDNNVWRSKAHRAYADLEDFSSFVNLSTLAFDFNKVVTCVNDKLCGLLNQSQLQKAQKTLLSKGDLKKRLDANGIWKTTKDTFDFSSKSELWSEINGHDIARFLRFVSSDAYEAYSERNNSLNRKFEMDVIRNYDRVYLSKTKIGQRLQNDNVLAPY